jgi:BMFP domain-containing protein YqiC
MLIKKLSNQQMINTYSSQVENGIAQISSKKNSKEEAFRKQIEKAYSNVLKGRESYELASRILDSEPMKARSNDARVIALKKQIKNLEEMYALKDKAFGMLNSDKKAALADLKKAFKIANVNYRILPEADLIQMKDSLSSWSGGADFVTNTNNPTANGISSGSTVRSPGELHQGSDFEAFNDLSATIRKKKSDPLKDLQDIKNEIDYEMFFAKTKEKLEVKPLLNN